MRSITLATLLAAFTALSARPAAAEQNLPLLRSRSKILTVIDGDHVKRNYWVLMPERNPDIYYVEIPMKPHSVTFRSDIDSITVPLKFGDQFDFVVLLNDETHCRTQIRATFKKLQPYSRIGAERGSASDTIPFDLGDNDKIYVKGRLNGSETLNFQFDLGCGGSIIKKDSSAKAAMRFDGTANLTNSDGNNVVRSSSANRLEIGSLRWEELPFLEAQNMTHREDGLLGNTLFQDKVIEVNYDRSELVIHDRLPSIDATYSKHAIILDGVVPYIHGSLTVGGQKREGWFMFDTGAYTSILRTNQASAWSKLYGELQKMVSIGDETSLAPGINIGDYQFADFNYSITNGERDDGQLGLLGNDLLKRFNVILDNQNGFIYLQPNSLAGAAYANPEYYLARVIVAAGLVSAIGCAALVYRRRAAVRRRSPRAQRHSPASESVDGVS